jgi:hypothetical protein
VVGSSGLARANGEGQNRTRERRQARPVVGSSGLARANGEGQNRTADTTIFSRVLYQLSYLAGTLRLAALHRRPEADTPPGLG